MADIRKRTSGKGTTYQVRFFDPSTKNGFGYRSFKTRKSAQSFKNLRELEKDRVAAGLLPELRTATGVHESIESWLDICHRIGRDGREPVEAVTLIEYRRRAGVMLRYPWDKSLEQLEPRDIVAFRTWLLENVSRDLARRTLSSFHSVLIEMKLQGKIRTDPGADITIRSNGRYDSENSEIEIPSDQEMRDILGAADAMGQKNGYMAQCWRRYRPMIYLAAFTGLRSSELRGLPWAHMHPDRVDVRQRADASGTIGPVKSRAARRTRFAIFMPPN